MDIQTQLRHAAKTMREGGVFDRQSVAMLLERAARDIDSHLFTIEQWRNEYEGRED